MMMDESDGYYAVEKKKEKEGRREEVGFVSFVK